MNDNPHEREDHRIKSPEGEKPSLVGRASLVFVGRVVTRSWIGVRVIRLNCHVLLSRLCAGETIAAATQQECASEQGSSEKRADCRKPRAFHGSTGLLA